MLSVIGAGLLICGTSAWGFSAVLRLKKRTQILAALISALELLESELTFKLAALPELMETLSKTAPPAVRGLFVRCAAQMPRLGNCSFRRIWNECISNSPELLLKEDERECLEELGTVLGRYELSQQRRVLHYTRSRLYTFLDRAENERSRQSRLYGTLGVASGVMAVLILI
ncbi:MAG: stage III sporulation protein AB [Oscillospiraceae bacterium]|nr:stage III sporulation protein AB [Oscillospiraceae bacterium]